MKRSGPGNTRTNFLHTSTNKSLDEQSEPFTFRDLVRDELVHAPPEWIRGHIFERSPQLFRSRLRLSARLVCDIAGAVPHHGLPV